MGHPHFCRDFFLAESHTLPICFNALIGGKHCYHLLSALNHKQLAAASQYIFLCNKENVVFLLAIRFA
jgi:hypothetical protein